MEPRRRFLRDSILDQMLRELRDIQDKVELSEREFTSELGPILQAALELYESNKVVLSHIEKAIASVRCDASPTSYLGDMLMAATHIRMGLTAFHSVLVEYSAASAGEEKTVRTNPPSKPAR